MKKCTKYSYENRQWTLQVAFLSHLGASDNREPVNTSEMPTTARQNVVAMHNAVF